jgi:hypothetical protein
MEDPDNIEDELAWNLYREKKKLPEFNWLDMDPKG